MLTVLITVLVSCDLGDSEFKEQYGSLTVNTGATKSILPQASDLEIHHYNISGYLTTDESKTFSDDFTGTSFTKEKMVAGTWSIVVKGYNASNQMISKSTSQSVVIKQNANTSTTISVSYLTTGQGTFSITMRIPSDQNVMNVHVVLAPVSSHLESTNIVYDIPVDTGKVEGTKYLYEDSRSISSGDYDVTITMLDSDGDPVGLPILESLHVHKEMISSFVWAWDDSYFESVPNPVFATEPGTYEEGQTVTITTSDSDSIIYYTIDGSDPRSSQTRIKYTIAIKLEKNTTISACCVKGKLTSEMITGVFKIKVAVPVLSVKGGTYTDSQKVTISCSTPNASIYYTTDGRSPYSYGKLYDEDDEILISKNTTLMVFAKKTDFVSSDIVSAKYIIDSQSIGITIDAPSTVYDYELVVPEDWSTGVAVINGVKATIYPNKTLKGVYYWYIDGEEIRYKDGRKPNYDLLLGTGSGGNYELTPGAHIITLRVKMDGTSYSCSYPLIVSGSGIGVSGDNTTHGISDYKVGDVGPSGGFIIYDNSSYKTSFGGNTEWRYIEISKEEFDAESAVCVKLDGYGMGQPGHVFSTSTSIGGCVYNKSKMTGGLSDEVVSYSSNGFNDWYLPTVAELLEAYNNLHLHNIGNFKTNHSYVSSSVRRTTDGRGLTHYVDFSNGTDVTETGDTQRSYRAVRLF